MVSTEIAIELPFQTTKIKELIPHRYPFLLVDRIIEYIPGEKITGIKSVSSLDPYLQGHFPNQPVVPGVLQIEALAQTSAVFGRLARPESRECFLTEVSSARFRRPIVPGDQILLKVVLEKVRGSFFWFVGEAVVSDEVAAQVKFSAKII